MSVNILYRLYVLRDPRTDAIRYAGVTRTPLTRRLAEHISAARRARDIGRDTHRSNWICTLLAAGLRPLIEEVAVTTADTWATDERTLIERLRGQGCELTNRSDGGEGPYGEGLAPGSTSRQRAATTLRARREREGYPEASRARLSAINQGRKRSPETRARMSAAAKARGVHPDAGAKISAALKGRTQSPEAIAARVASRRANGPWFRPKESTT